MTPRPCRLGSLILVLAAFAAALLPRPGPAEEGLPAPLREVGFDQKPGEQVPLDLAFRDETGREVKLREFFGKGNRPVVISLVYFECPMLCGLAMEGLVRSLRGLTFAAGREFDLLTVSFDPRETPALAAAKKEGALAAYGREGAAAGWRFLTGGEEAIAGLTRAVGFRYVWDEKKKQFAHATGVIVLTPEGVVSRYLFGIEYPPRDLQFAVIEAADGKVGSVIRRVVLQFCYFYDPARGRYSLAVLNLVRAGGVATVLAIAGSIAFLLRRERRARSA